MEVNWQQVEGALRTVIAVLGGMAVTAGWTSSDDLQRLLSPELWAALGTLAPVVVLAWSYCTHRKSSAVAVVAAMPEVAEVKTMATPAGRALANEVGSNPLAVVTTAAH